MGTEERERYDRPELVRHEEELRVGKATKAYGSVRARKIVETERVAEVLPLSVEHAQIARVPAAEGDSGDIETLPDGSISIPMIEEELVVTTRTVVRERVIIRKQVLEEARVVEADLRRERIDVETTGNVELDGAA
jgi:uncharacterized protein (TIGR02271 family)